MFRITNINLYINYFFTFIKLGINIIFIPLLINFLKVDEINLYFQIQAILGLIILFDFGFLQASTRYLSHNIVNFCESSGEIKFTNKIQKSIFSVAFFSDIIIEINRYYIKIVFFLLFFFLLFFIININTGIFFLNDASAALIIFIIGGLLNLLFNYQDIIFLATGKTNHYRIISLLTTILYVFISYLLLYRGYGLDKIGLVFIGTILLNRILLHVVLRFEFGFINLFGKSDNIIFKNIFNSSWKIGISNIGSFLSQKSFYLIMPFILNSNEIFQFTIIDQLIRYNLMLSGFFISTYMPRLHSFRAINNYIGLRLEFIKHLKYGLGLFFIGCCFILILPEFNYLIDSKIFHKFINKFMFSAEYIPAVLLYMIIILFEMIHSNCANLLLVDEDIPFYKSSIVSGILFICIVFLINTFFYNKIYVIIVSYGISQLYNNFRWPLEVKRRFFSFN